MSEARARTAADRKLHPENYSRLGVPDGMRKAEAKELWAVARTKADEFMVALEAQGVVEASTPGIGHNSQAMIPDTDEGIAKVALRELCALALGPGKERVKGTALNLLLKFTKPVPTLKTETTIQAVAHDWLLKASEAMRAMAHGA
jgi:hypothetical protein